jgi:hypothetical protein
MAWKRNKEDEFDAVHAAEELDDAVGSQDAPSTEEYIRTLEVELEGMGNLLSQKEALLGREAGCRSHR